VAVQTFVPLALVAKTGRPMWEAADEGDDSAFDDRDRGLDGPEVVADQGGSGLVVLGVAGNRGWRGGDAREAFAARRGDVSTVDSFDKGLRINGLIAGVRVVLRIVEGVFGGRV
jgi:hypothetical protein